MVTTEEIKASNATGRSATMFNRSAAHRVSHEVRADVRDMLDMSSQLQDLQNGYAPGNH